MHKPPRYEEVKPLIAVEETQPRAVSFMQALRIPVSHPSLFYRHHLCRHFYLLFVLKAQNHSRNKQIADRNVQT